MKSKIALATAALLLSACDYDPAKYFPPKGHGLSAPLVIRASVAEGVHIKNITIIYRATSRSLICRHIILPDAGEIPARIAKYYVVNQSEENSQISIPIDRNEGFCGWSVYQIYASISNNLGREVPVILASSERSKNPDSQISKGAVIKIHCGYAGATFWCPAYDSKRPMYRPILFDGNTKSASLFVDVLGND